MNWITTNLRIPEDVYMELRMQAARERRSVAAVIREKLVAEKKPKAQKADELLKRINTLGRQIAKKNPGLNLSKAVIEMRYEQ